MTIKLPPEAEKRIEEIKKLYPDHKSAVMNALYIAQEYFGYISDEAVEWVASKVDIAPVHVREVATFYTMYYKKPVGKYHFQVCRTLSCAVCGATKLTKYLHERFKIEPGEITKDGMWSYEEVECLGSCGTAPMIEINDIYFENLTVDKLADVIDRIEKEKPDLRYSTIKDELGAGLKGFSKSEVI